LASYPQAGTVWSVVHRPEWRGFGKLSTGRTGLAGEFGHAGPMPPRPCVPTVLATAPFRGSTAVADGLLTPAKLRGRSWRRLLPDVYVHHEMLLDHRIWCAAVSLTLRSGTAIGGLSAAHLFGSVEPGPDAPVSVVASRRAGTHTGDRIRVHHTVLDPSDITSISGLPVTTPERTAFDLGRRAGRRSAVVALDAMLHAEMLDLGAVADLARQRHWWPGIGRLHRAIRLADGRSESPMETILRLLLLEAGLPAAEPQFEVRDSRGRLVGRVDLAWPLVRLAVEYEGDHHRDREQFRRDIGRVNALRMAGWAVLRLTADDVLRRPEKTVALVAAELARLR
jgi:very-short-patch-repair endonuclease